MKEIKLPTSYNYIAVFLTFMCNLKCSYCINANDTIDRRRRLLSGQEWVNALDCITSRPDLPLTLGGGEPTLHPDFYFIVNELHDLGHYMDLLTNSMFHVDVFMRQVGPEVFKRDAPYASIRVSYHPETMVAESVIYRVKKLLDKGYYVGIWSVDHPRYKGKIEEFAARCSKEGIDFRLKEFLGMYEGKLYGNYRYPGACRGDEAGKVMCKTTELIIGPNGNVYRCHADLYLDHTPIGHIMDENFFVKDIHRPCNIYGYCNPCDNKSPKYNRFQEKIHCSIHITDMNGNEL